MNGSMEIIDISPPHDRHVPIILIILRVSIILLAKPVNCWLMNKLILCPASVHDKVRQKYRAGMNFMVATRLRSDTPSENQACREGPLKSQFYPYYVYISIICGYFLPSARHFAEAPRVPSLQQHCASRPIRVETIGRASGQAYRSLKDLFTYVLILIIM
jgi:hypothetical protein